MLLLLNYFEDFGPADPQTISGFRPSRSPKMKIVNGCASIALRVPMCFCVIEHQSHAIVVGPARVHMHMFICTHVMAQQEFGLAASHTHSPPPGFWPSRFGFGLAAAQAPLPVRGSAQPLRPAMPGNWNDRGPHPAPQESEWIVEGVNPAGYATWMCELCDKEVTDGHLKTKAHQNKKSWKIWSLGSSPPGPPAQAPPRDPAPPASNASSATAASAWLTTPWPATSAASSASASSALVVIDAAAPATAQGGTVRIELPVDVAFALKDSLDRALAGRRP